MIYSKLYCLHKIIFYSVRKQVVNIPSYVVRLDSQKLIDFALNSPYGGGPPGKNISINFEEYIRQLCKID